MFDIVYKKNDPFCCESCEDHIANFDYDVHEKDIIIESMFRWVNQSFVFREIFRCKKCNHDLMTQLRFSHVGKKE